jgi:hypothetical protein
LTVNPGWLYWSSSDFEKISPDSNKIAGLLFITRKKEICLLYKSTPIIKGKFAGLIGNLFDKGSTPAIITIDADKLGSCFAVQYFNGIPEDFRPNIPLEINMVKDTAWENAEMDITFIILPTLIPILFGTDVQSTLFDEAFAEKMTKISAEHGFWAKTMSDLFEQVQLNKDSLTIAERLISSKAPSKACNPMRAATKGIREATIATSGPFIESSLVGKKHEEEQVIVRSFFCRNPTPAPIEIIDEDEPKRRIPIHCTSAPTNKNPPAVTATAPTIPAAPTTAIPPPSFYTQLIETMKNMQAPQQLQKIVVESWDH